MFVGLKQTFWVEGNFVIYLLNSVFEKFSEKDECWFFGKCKILGIFLKKP